MKTPTRLFKQRPISGAMSPTTLYHFTCRTWWHFIKQDGISKGEVPLSATNVLQYPNLTSNPDPRVQKWSGAGANKTAVRISVTIPAGDRNLISWRAFADQHRVDRKWYRCLDASGGWEARNWWIYQGVIRPEWFREVDFLDGGIIDEFEKGLLSVAEKSPGYEDFLRRTRAVDRNGIVFPVDSFAAAMAC